jgi:hypothetical protein
VLEILGALGPAAVCDATRSPFYHVGT